MRNCVVSHNFTHLLVALIRVALVLQPQHCTCECLPSSTLSTACLADDHVSVASDLAVKDLDDLGDVLGDDLRR